MKVTITDEKENPVMNRKVVKGEIAFDDATPKRYDMKIEIAKHLKVNPGLFILRRVFNVFGDRKVVFEAHVYKNEKDVEKINKVIIEKNKKPAPKEAAEDKPAEEKPAKEKPKAKPADAAEKAE